MQPLPPSILVDQVRDLPRLAREQLSPFDLEIQATLAAAKDARFRRVVLTGDGDSYHAARAAELAFNQFAGLPCYAMSAQQFLDYHVAWMPVTRPRDTLVVAISAGGRTERVVQSIERARERQAFTVALTGTAGSPVARVADHTLLVELPDMGPSPGIRSYNASLMGLMLLAIRLGEQGKHCSAEEGDALRGELVGLADVMEDTTEATVEPARRAAESFRDATMMIFLGSGPSYGTALFSAAKQAEAPNRFAAGQDLEEWHHVERLAYPDDMPTIIIAPPGRARWRALDTAAMASALGRQVVVVAAEDDTEMTRHAGFVWPVRGQVREAFSPLVYHIGADLFASYLTEQLGRMIFQRDHPAFGLIYAARDAG